MRAAFDTNVLVSAALFGNSVPGQALRHVLRQGRVLISDETVTELAEVLGRPKFDRYVTAEERGAFLQALIHEAELIEITRRIRACRDPKDDKFLELIVSGSATHLISGDEDLLCLNPFEGVPVLTPATFMAHLSTDPTTQTGS